MPILSQDQTFFSRINKPSTSSQPQSTARRDDKVVKKSKKRRRAYDSDSDSENDAHDDSDDDSQRYANSEQNSPVVASTPLHTRTKRSKAHCFDSSSSSFSSECDDSPPCPLSSSTSRGQVRSSMTLGELLQPMSSRMNSDLDAADTPVVSSYFAQARCTALSSEDIQHTSDGKTRNVGGSSSANANTGDRARGGGDDVWMEDSAFDEVCVATPDMSSETKTKRGRAAGRQGTGSHLSNNSSTDVNANNRNKYGPLVTTRRGRAKVLGRRKGVRDKDEDDDEEEEGAHRPSFPGKPFTTALAEPLTLTYKDYKDKRSDSSSSTAADSDVTSTSTETGNDVKSVHNGAEGINQDKEKEKEKERVSDTSRVLVKTTRVPVYTMRYLKGYQVEGVRWLWTKYAKGLGCILGDDMGLGKTVQIAAFLMAIFEKSGKKAIDVPLNRERSRHGYNLTAEETWSSSSIRDNGASIDHEDVSLCPPCLVIAPASLITNWQEELHRWGYFLASALDNKQDSLGAIEAAKQGRVEVVLGSYSKMEMYSRELGAVAWSVVIWDEGHMLKNDNTKGYKAACRINKVRSRIILSGTPIQNKHEEFWCLLNLVTAGRFNDKKSFKTHFSNPIKKGKQLSATEQVMQLGHARVLELRKVASRYLLRRDKSILEGLKGKEEIIVYCELTALQKQLYQEVLALPDVDNCRYYSSPCPCGSNEQRSKCCSEKYIVPYLGESDGIDPRAFLWKSIHPDNEECSHCPTCVLLSVMPILSKIASHPTLLQADRGEDLSQNFAHCALSSSSMALIGGSVHSSRFEDVISNVQHSGKMKSIDILLSSFSKNREKTLLFSYSTQTLNVIENYVKSRGWRYCRLDGTTLAKTRQAMVDKFNKDTNILVFLISTKAGGVGLNLTSASKVIIFDCNWNPAQDAQAQDRAYRIGQLEHVSVYRLISQGTIEEVAYMRQIYKKVMQNTAICENGDDSYTRGNFEGVQGDNEARGELFGCENMLQFEHGSILLRLRTEHCVRGQEITIISSGVYTRAAVRTCQLTPSSSMRGSLSGPPPPPSLSTTPHNASNHLKKQKSKSKSELNKLVTLNERSAQELVAIFATKEGVTASSTSLEAEVKECGENSEKAPSKK